MPDELWQLDVAGLLALYENKEASPVEVLADYAKHIADVDPAVGAFTELTLESAEQTAKAATEDLAKGSWRGLLHGIPVGVKGLFDIAGTRTTYGSMVFKDHVPARDASAVERLRAAGAIVVGMTRAHEIGWGMTSQHAELGSTKNPWNLDRVPGGSSGGSAAAVAAGMLPLALGTDTGASVRQPAAYCGVVGLKPTFGRIPKRGAISTAPSFDTPGLLAREPGDAARGLEALSGYDPLDTSTYPNSKWVDEGCGGNLEGIRLGIAPCLHTMPLDAKHDELFWHAVDMAAGAFGGVREITIDKPETIRPSWATIQAAEAYYHHTEVLGTYPSSSHLYGSDVRGRLEQATNVSVTDYLAAKYEGELVCRRFEKAFESMDVLLMPVTGGPPSTCERPETVEHRGEEIPFRDLVLPYTVPQNLTLLPSCSVPVGLDDTGVPVGIQVTAAAGREDVVLRVVSEIKRLLPQRPWPQVAG